MAILRKIAEMNLQEKDDIAVPIAQLQRIITGYMAKFAEELSRRLYVEADRALPNAQLPIGSDEAAVLRRINVTCDRIVGINKQSEDCVHLRDDLDMALIMLEASLDPDSLYFVAIPFITKTEIEKLKLSIQGISYGSA